MILLTYSKYTGVQLSLRVKQVMAKSSNIDQQSRLLATLVPVKAINRAVNGCQLASSIDNIS